MTHVFYVYEKGGTGVRMVVVKNSKERAQRKIYQLSLSSVICEEDLTATTRAAGSTAATSTTTYGIG